ncbi:cupin domain-containing protein [Dongia sp.]|uniref:cupin domain-containing protein n=1 Tax=Dongia sp. TaxID=1977262 RepID=UPI0035B3F37E
MSVKLIRFGSNPPAIEAGAPGNVISGNPSTKLQNYYTDKTGQFFAGIWESSPGKWQVNYGEEEFCAILAGKATLTDAEGVAETFQKGDAFIIPKGFTGSWETIEAVKKWYVIFEPKA